MKRSVKMKKRKWEHKVILTILPQEEKQLNYKLKDYLERQMQHKCNQKSIQ
jgi:hypothetical protein